MVQRAPYQQQFATGAQMPRGDGLSRVVGALGGIVQQHQQEQDAARQNRLLQFRNDLSAIDTGRFVDQQSLDQHLVQMREAAMLDMGEVNDQERKNLLLDMERYNQAVRQQWQTQKDTLADLALKQNIDRTVNDYDFTAMDVEGNPIYDWRNPESINTLREDLYASIDSQVPQEQGIAAQIRQQELYARVEPALSRYKKYMSAQQERAREASAAVAQERLQDDFLSGAITLEQADERVREIAIAQSNGTANEEAVELAVMQAREGLIGLQAEQMLAQGDFSAVRTMLNDEELWATLSPETRNRVAKSLLVQSVKTAKEYTANQYERAVRGDAGDNTEQVYDNVLEQTGDVTAANEAVEQVNLGRAVHNNAMRPLGEVLQNIEDERQHVSDKDTIEYSKNQEQLDVLQKQRLEQQKILENDPVAYLRQMSPVALDTNALLAEQARLGVQNPRVLSKDQAAAIVGELSNEDIVEHDKVGLLAQQIQEYQLNSDALDALSRDLIEAGLPKRIEPLMYGLAQGTIPAQIAPRVFSALMTEAPKLSKDEKDAHAVNVDDALKVYTEYAQAVEELTGDYGFREKTLEPTRNALLHLSAVGFDDAEQNAAMLMGNRQAVVEDNIVLLLPQGHGMTGFGVQALQRVADEAMQPFIEEQSRDMNWVTAAAYSLLADEAVWFSEDGESFALINPYNGITLLTKDRASVLAAQQEHTRLMARENPHGTFFLGLR